MNKDPHYIRIIEGLSRISDGNLFEACVCDLLRDELRNLIPVRGGSDAGIDGLAIKEGRKIALICTTQKRVLNNVIESLDTQIREGVGTGKVLVVTSQDLGAIRCRNIVKRIEAKGFISYPGVYTCHAIAQRLYNNSRWCRELLGISGMTSALGKVPKVIRPLRELPLIARDEEFDWLCKTNGDRLLVGQPGVGKTYLLQAMVNSNHGLFLNLDDSNLIADSIRNQQPSAIFVEDAHTRLDVIEFLRGFREQTGVHFDIVADCWPGSINQLTNALAISSDACLELKPLKPGQIVELVKSAGIIGPPALINELVRQSVGCPGRTALLVHTCLNYGIKDILAGDTLYQTITASFSQVLSDQALQILAVFALGGSSGLSIDAVARFLGYPPGQVQISISKLAMGGLVQDLENDLMAVYPEPLRSALVKNHFFNQPAPLSWKGALRICSDKLSAIRSLIGSYRTGAAIPSVELMELIESVDKLGVALHFNDSNQTDLWDSFAWLDSRHANMILDKYPDKLHVMPVPLLHRVPERVIPLLLSAAVGDNRPLHNATDHPLRIIDDWIVSARPGTDEVIGRRKLLMGVAIKWILDGLDQSVGLRGLASAFSPRFEQNYIEPGQLANFCLRKGAINLSELEELSQYWNAIGKSLCSIKISAWPMIFELLDDWVSPDWTLTRLPEPYEDVLVKAARAMLTNFLELAKGHPGVLSKLKRRAEHLDLDLEVELDVDYKTLFPKESFGDNWKEVARQQETAAMDLAQKWSKCVRGEVIKKLQWCIGEAQVAGVGHSNYCPYVCSKIAEYVDECLEWVGDLIDVRTTSDWIRPFLTRAAQNNSEGWDNCALRCLDIENFERLALEIILCYSEGSSSALENILNKADKHPEIVEHICWLEQIRESWIQQLLGLGSSKVREAVAVGLWRQRPKGSVPDNLRRQWDQAVIECVDSNHTLQEILTDNPNLAFEWLMKKMSKDAASYRAGDRGCIHAACSSLSVEQKRALLEKVVSDGLIAPIIECLIGNNVELYAELLENSSLKRFHLIPLGRRTDESWAQMAIEALAAGYTANDLVDSAHMGSHSWTGTISSECEERINSWSSLLSHTDSRIREAATIGTRIAREETDMWRKREELREFDEYYG